MDTKRKIIRKTALSTFSFFSLVVLIAGLAFLPSVRNVGTAQVAYAVELDGEAMSVLNGCIARAAVGEFQTSMSGVVKARVMGIPYTQKITGARHICGDTFTDTAESISTFVKAAIKREYTLESGFSVLRGEYRRGAFVYGAPQSYTRDEYISTYGMPSTGIVKYDLDNSIVCAVKESESRYKYVLDAERATHYSRNEVSALLGGGQYPVYESVEFTLVADGNKVTEITCRENFRVNKFGGVSCKAEYTEKFIYA